MNFWFERSGFLSRWILRLSLALIAVIMLFPFVYVIAVSFSSYADVAGKGLVLFPAHPTLEAYQYVLANNIVTRALGISIVITLLGTAISLITTIAMAYGLSSREVPGRRFILVMVLFTILLAPGIIPKYLVVKQLSMLDTIWSLIIPSAVSAFNLIVMRNFFMNIPSELEESAKLDGANDIQVLWHIILPLSRAVIAAIGLFYGVHYWNSFFDAILYINDPAQWPVQVVLRQFVLQGSSLSSANDMTQIPPPAITTQMAVVVLATIPILLVYPFLQKYFTKGVLTGSIKG